MDSCPICTRPVQPRAQNKSFPFCSARCRQVDLGCWLDEKYRIPVSDDSDTAARKETEAEVEPPEAERR